MEIGENVQVKLTSVGNIGRTVSVKIIAILRHKQHGETMYQIETKHGSSQIVPESRLIKNREGK